MCPFDFSIHLAILKDLLRKSSWTLVSCWHLSLFWLVSFPETNGTREKHLHPLPRRDWLENSVLFCQAKTKHHRVVTQQNKVAKCKEILWESPSRMTLKPSSILVVYFNVNLPRKLCTSENMETCKGFAFFYHLKQ